MIMELIRNLWRYTISLIINLMLIPLILLRTTYMKGFSVAFGNFFTKPVLPKFDEKKFLKERGLSDFKSGYVEIEASGVNIHYMQTGKKGAPLLLCVHGFPEFWYSWHYVMKHFSADFNVVAIDMRGYHKSSKPLGVSSYALKFLTNDLREVIEQLGYKQATVAGHDWGAVISWQFAVDYPAYVRNLVILNGPMVKGFQDFLSDYWWQKFTRFWYSLGYQLPWCAEFLFSRYDHSFINEIFNTGMLGPIEDASRKLDADEIAYYKNAVCAPMTGPINYYRANNLTGGGMTGDPHPYIGCPVLICWGMKDKIVDFRMVPYTQKYLKNSKVVQIKKASHWVALDQPKEVISAMAAFFEEQEESSAF